MKIQNYIKVNGVKIKLTDEQKQQVRDELEKRKREEERTKNPYARVERKQPYSSFDIYNGNIITRRYMNFNDDTDDRRFENAFYINNEEYAKKIVHLFHLYLLFDKFSWDNDRPSINTKEISNLQLMTNGTTLTIPFKDKSIIEKAYQQIFLPYLKKHNLKAEDFEN